ncbi:MAG: ABC-F type ribosomal protection protein [Acidaminococcales bacterium]|nr:ABC-F type ribosomal protection protein [Acidaminococcales bacterium]
MSLISVSNLTFAYAGSYDNIFENVNFRIETDWKLGFIGRNGRGKTTFLNLLLDKYEYAGNISASVSFAYFPYDVPDKQINTIDAINSIGHDCLDWELRRELSLLEVSDDILNRRFNALSAGEQTKVLLAVLFLKENSFLLIDEPTNHLDMAGRAIVSAYLKSKKGFILVSHDRAFLDNCVDHILSINKTNIEIQRGNFSSWLLNKECQDSQETAENERLKKDIKKLNEAAKRTAAWSCLAEKTKHGTRNSGLRPDRGFIGHKSAKMMKRSKAIAARQQSAIDDKSGLCKNIESADNLKITQMRYHTSRLIALEGVSVFYGEKTACQNVSFSIEQGDRVALSGKNGSGKSSVIKLICGENMQYTGVFHKGSRLAVSYVSQDTSFLSGSLSGYALRCGIDESLFKAILRKLNFSKVQFEKDMRDFSGGQKKKVLIAQSLCEKAHLHVWDEPLNFIDVISRMQIENLLIENAPTILFVEHDSVFCDNIATKKIMLS